MAETVTLLEDLVITRVDTVDAGANQAAHITLYKRDDTNTGGTTVSDETITKEQLDEAVSEAVTKAVEETTAIFAAQYIEERDAFTKAVEAVEVESTPLEKRDDLPEDVRKRLIEDREEREALAKRLEQVEDQDRTRRAEAIAKSIPNVGVGESDMVILIKRLEEQLDDSTHAQVVDLLKTAEARIGEGNLLKTAGKDGEDSPTREKFEKAVAQVMEEDRVSRPTAVAKVYRTDRELAAEFMNDEIS